MCIVACAAPAGQLARFVVHVCAQWLELKLTAMQLLARPEFQAGNARASERDHRSAGRAQLSFVLDKSCMFSVTSKSDRDGRPREHAVCTRAGSATFG